MDHKGGPIEAAISTDLRGEPYNFSLWDIQTGTQLVIFKGNKSNPIPKCLQLIDNNYFITANDNLLHFWSIFNRKCQDHKLFLPGRPSTLCMSPCGNYLVAGISEMIYIWQLRSGNLLAHTQRHYQTVSVLKTSQDGTFLFSGGEDGMVLVWPFADLVSGTHNTGALNLDQSRRDGGVNEPRFVWQHHSAQVTDIHITNGGRCLTTSLDSTINIYSYKDGKRLYCVTMPSPIWSVVMNKNETMLLLGAQDGNIYEVVVSSLSLSLLNSQDKDKSSQQKPLLVGHKGKVTGLIISADGTRLVSASIDSTCKIWNIYQRKLLQDIKHQAPLANLASLIVPDALALTSMTQSQAKPPLLYKPLKRNLYKPPRDSTVMSEDIFEEASTTIVHIKNQSDLWGEPLESNCLVGGHDSSDQRKFQSNGGEISSNDHGQSVDGETSNELKAKIKELYLLSAEKIFRDAAEDSLKPYKPIVDQIIEAEEKSSSNLLSKSPVASTTNGFGKEKKQRQQDKSMTKEKKVSISPQVEVHLIKRIRK